MSVEMFPGTNLTPEVLLHRVLENIGAAKGVIVLTIDKDGAIEISNSAITLHELSYAAMTLQAHTIQVCCGEPPDGVEFPAPAEPA